MPNSEIAQLIGDHLGPGLPHPGNPARDEPPRLLPLVAFRTTGMPPEMAEHARTTAKVVGEAVVNLIETQGNSVIIKRAELDELRAAEDTPGDLLPVVCMSCKQTMLWLRVVNGRALIAPHLLGDANLNCPHSAEVSA